MGINETASDHINLQARASAQDCSAKEVFVVNPAASMLSLIDEANLQLAHANGICHELGIDTDPRLFAVLHQVDLTKKLVHAMWEVYKRDVGFQPRSFTMPGIAS